MDTITTSLLTTILGLISLEGIKYAINFRNERITNKLLTKQKDMEVTSSAMDVVDKLEERLNAKADKITELEKTVAENNTKLRDLEWTKQEHDRKIAGMQNTIKKEVRLRQFAERLICFQEDCTLRKPALGTYKYCDDCDDCNEQTLQKK